MTIVDICMDNRVAIVRFKIVVIQTELNIYIYQIDG